MIVVYSQQGEPLKSGHSQQEHLCFTGGMERAFRSTYLFHDLHSYNSLILAADVNDCVLRVAAWRQLG